MNIIDEKGVLIETVESFDGIYYVKGNTLFHKEALKLSETAVQLPNEVWALPQQAKLVNGTWVQNPDYEEVVI